MIEKGLHDYGGGNVRRVSDSEFAGAVGALKLAMATPPARWEEIGRPLSEAAA